MIKSGRLIKIIKKKKNIFLLLSNIEIIQVVVKADNFCVVDNLKVGDILSCNVHEDLNNNSKYSCEYNSYILEELKIVSKCEEKYEERTFKNIEEYSNSKFRVRNFLEAKGYTEVNVPILTDGEISSKSTSFVTNYSKTGKKLFLRKTMDSFLRIMSCWDMNKIYSIGPCFRNEYVTSKNQSEFEMLSIFTNYMSYEEAVDFCIDLLKIILDKENLEINFIDNDDYEKLDNINGIYLISNYKNDINTYVETNEFGVNNEFKVKINGVTVIHGVEEIENHEKYIDKINIQGKKKEYGELERLEQALKCGAPLCFNLGISIIRILASYNNKKIKDYDIFSFSRLNLKEK